VLERAGRVVQYIGVQNDVTARVEAERALREERDRVEHYATRVEELAFCDPLTGLLNRRRVSQLPGALLWQARLDGQATALLYLDLDGWPAWAATSSSWCCRGSRRRRRGAMPTGSRETWPGRCPARSSPALPGCRSA
jgi:hypothetical protein